MNIEQGTPNDEGADNVTSTSTFPVRCSTRTMRQVKSHIHCSTLKEIWSIEIYNRIPVLMVL